MPPATAELSDDRPDLSARPRRRGGLIPELAKFAPGGRPRKTVDPTLGIEGLKLLHKGIKLDEIARRLHSTRWLVVRAMNEEASRRASVK